MIREEIKKEKKELEPGDLEAIQTQRFFEQVKRRGY